MLKIGVIADDFTGATDIASFLVLNGLSTIQLTQVKEDLRAPDVEAIVISGKTRSCPVSEAISESLKAYEWLRKNGCKQIYFKYCSTFDSTAKGNIGPVADALMQAIGTDFTIFSPSLPVNGRTVYQGYLYAGNVLLQDSGMRNHPITPMTDSYLVRLVEMQSKGKCGVIDCYTLERGVEAVRERMTELKAQGYSYAAVDALNEQHLLTQGQAFADLPLVTGGSGLAIGLARAVRESNADAAAAQQKGYPQGKKAVAFSGSCSVMTNRQVDLYRKNAPSYEIDVGRLLASATEREAQLKEAVDFVTQNSQGQYAPLVFATANPDKLKEIQQRFGGEISARAVEECFASLAKTLRAQGYERFIVAGGETSGIVTKSLEVEGFYIGPAVAPGVPWVRSINSPISLILKSGNFGDEEFFIKAQRDYPV